MLAFLFIRFWFDFGNFRALPTRLHHFHSYSMFQRTVFVTRDYVFEISATNMTPGHGNIKVLSHVMTICTPILAKFPSASHANITAIDLQNPLRGWAICNVECKAGKCIEEVLLILIILLFGCRKCAILSHHFS